MAAALGSLVTASRDTAHGEFYNFLTIASFGLSVEGSGIVTQNLTQFSRLMVQVFHVICIFFSVMTVARCCTSPLVSRQR